MFIRGLYLITYLVFSFVSLANAAGDTAEYRSGNTMVRLPDKSFFEPYTYNKDFDYGIDKPGKMERRKIWQVIRDALNEFRNALVLLPLFFRILSIAVIIAAIYIVVTKTKTYRFFYKGRELITPPEYSETEVFKEETDFDNAIGLALKAGNFRYVIRLLYIKILYQLEVKEMITYSREKTGSDYCNEINDRSIGKKLAILTSIYYNIWYGERNPLPDQFQRLATEFQDFYSRIHYN